MNHPTDPSSHEPSEAQIQHAAYMLWLQNGKPTGHELEHWFAAKELLRHQLHRSAPTLPYRRPTHIRTFTTAQSRSRNN